MLTHGHFDHVAGINSLQLTPSIPNVHGVKVVMHKDDLIQLKSVNNYLPMFGIPEITIPTVDIYVQDGDILKLGNYNIEVIHTPGHTQGGVCYKVDDKLFSGDTIFKECVGRCDLEGGDFSQIIDSINNKIFTLPERVQIYPGHGDKTNVGWEKLHNKCI